MDQRTQDFFNMADQHRVRMKDVAERSGIGSVSLSRWRNQRASPLTSSLAKAEQALHKIIEERAGDTHQ